MKRVARRIALSLVLALGVCALARTARASVSVFPAPAALLAQEAPSGASERELILDLINFVLLLAALGYFLRKPAKEFFAGRATSIRDRLAEGTKALVGARAKLGEAENKLANLGQEIEQLKAAAQKDMEAVHRLIRQETSEEAVKIQQFAQAQIAAAIRVARSELKHFAAREAVGQAREMIRGRLDEQGQRKLVSFFLADLRSTAGKN